MTSQFMIAMSENIGVKNTWSVAEYLNFTIITSLLFGLMFQIPLLMYFSSKSGLVDSKFFASKRRWVILALVFILAVISPQTDIASLIIMAAPLLVMYEIGVIASRRVSRRASQSG